jgi:hypothetical protein
MIRVCPHCGIEITYEKHQQFGGHVTNCKMNPKKQLIKEKIKGTKEVNNPIYLYSFNCKWCKKEYTIEAKEKDFNKDKYKKFCSRKCSSKFSRSFVDETKLKDCNCRRCGSMIKANIRTSQNVFCKSCREASICSMCGQYKCPDRSICSKYGIINSLKRLGFNESKLGSIDFYQEYERIKNLMIEEYEVKEMTLTQIGVKYNINFQTLSYLFKNLGVKVRTLSESSHLYVKNTTNPNPMPMSKKYQYKSGWHESWMGTKHFYRSSYEEEYFIKLDMEKVVYETESLRIEYFDTTRNKKRIAIPDIFIPSENLIIEIKSTYTYDEINMNDRAKSYKEMGYNMSLILGRDKRKLLKNYEVIEY